MAPIRTPELVAYATALVAVGSVSSAGVAGLLHRWMAPTRPAAFLPMYVGVMATVIVVSVPTLAALDRSAVAWTAVGGWRVLGGVAGGLLAGLLGLAGEARVRRRLLTRRAVPPWSAPISVGPPLSGAQVLVRPDQASVGASGRPAVLAWLLIVAAGEEVLFRGVAVTLALALPTRLLSVGGLLAGLILFCLSHQPMGWRETVGKAPIGAVTLAVALADGTVLPAVVAHALYNARRWADPLRPVPGWLPGPR